MKVKLRLNVKAKMINDASFLFSSKTAGVCAPKPAAGPWYMDKSLTDLFI